ncbi:MAG: phosphodiester glycosidase family protein [Clostridia bacterium]|nr:phosphodiester glycosidase family protein [Clostridia bacterium]
MKRKALLALALILALLPWATFRTVGETAEAERLAVSVTMPEKRESESFLLTDGFASTYVAFRGGSTVRFDLSGEAAQLVTVWESEPAHVILTCFSGESVLSESDLPVSFLTTVTTLPAGTTAVGLTFDQKNTAKLSEILAFGAGALPKTVHRWEAAAQPDVLLVVAYPGDEYRFFGGLLPTLLNDGASVAVCYVSDYSRARLEEGFDALQTLACGTYPVRLKIDGKLSLDYKELRCGWQSEKPDERFEEQLAALRPTVIVAPSDTDAAPEARLVSEIVQAVCERNPDSFQKLYLAESGEGAISIGDRALLLYGGQSANAVAKNALDGFHSVDFFEYAISAEGAYRLAMTQVGPDAKTDTLFEHVSVELHPPVTPTPVPTEEPVGTPTENPTVSPDPTAKETEPPEPTPTPKQQRRGWFSCAGREITPSPTAAPTAGPTPAPTQVQTAVPTEQPTPEPSEEPTPGPTETPAPERFAGHFLEEGEPEQFTMDRENGHWTFRDQSTDIDIRRVEARDPQGDPQIYFVAHVRMRKNMHRSGFGTEVRSGKTREKAYGIARRYGAVLLITGDNMINFEEAYTLRSTLIRDGRVYLHKTGESVMAWNERTLSFDLFEDRSFTTEELLERGYRDVYCFGPILVQNGEVRERLRLHRLSGNNPRTGVGQIEPGHFVVIVVDGKRPGVATGMQLQDFAALFKAEGCVSAYNLDGGLSADIVFMGEHLRERKEKRNLPDALLFGHTDLLPAEHDPSPENYEVGVDENGRTVIVPKKR